jgi:hypothetical protein
MKLRPGETDDTGRSHCAMSVGRIENESDGVGQRIWLLIDSLFFVGSVFGEEVREMLEIIIVAMTGRRRQECLRCELIAS